MKSYSKESGEVSAVEMKKALAEIDVKMSKQRIRFLIEEIGCEKEENDQTKLSDIVTQIRSFHSDNPIKGVTETLIDEIFPAIKDQIKKDKQKLKDKIKSNLSGMAKKKLKSVL